MMTRTRIIGLLLAAALLLSVAAVFLFTVCCDKADASVMEQMRRASVPERAQGQFEALDQFIDTYYLDKPVDEVGPFLQRLDQSGMLDNYPGTVPSVAAFMGVLLAENPARAGAWLKPQFAYTAPTADMLKYAVWLAGLQGDEKIAALFTEKPDYYATPSPKLLENSVYEERDLDMLWGAFLASGEQPYVGRVIDAACGYANTDGEALPNLVLRQRAVTALFTNAQGHERVLRMMKARAADTTNRCNASKITPLIPQGSRLENMDGQFGAVLMLADYDAARKMMGQPAGEMLSLPPVVTAKPGDKVGILLLFTGMEMGAGLETDVDYDLTITGPNGKPVANGEIKKKHATPGWRAGRFVIQHPGSFMRIVFEDAYPAGVYGVSITIRDNLGGKKISLQKMIKFEKP